MSELQPARKRRWRLGWALPAGLLLAGLLGLTVAVAWWRAAPGPPEPVGAQGRSGRWLLGLSGVERLHYAEFGPAGLVWELKSPRGDVRRQRFVFGRMRTQRVLRLLQAQATIFQSPQPVRIQARSAYFDAARERWVFTDGILQRGAQRRRFTRLFWMPTQRRLEWPKTRSLPPVLRFWEPVY